MERTAAPLPARAAAPRPRSEAALEHEADHMASLALAPGTAQATETVARAAPPRASLGGQPLPPALRQRFEPRFGVDFGQVRIHDDAAAHAQTRAAGAQASSLGASIVFAAGRWQPHTHEGLSLLAHELAHVAQSAHGAPSVWRHKPATGQPTSKWYQQAIDQVAAAQSAMATAAQGGGPVIEPSFHDTELALLALCEAVDQAKPKLVPKLLDALLKVGLRVQEGKFSEALLTELSARIHELGLGDEAARLRQAYSGAVKIQPYDLDTSAQRRRIDWITRLVSGAKDGAATDSAEAAAASLRRFARAYAGLRIEYGQIDFDAVASDRRFSSRNMVLRPMMSRVEYYDAVVEQIERWHTAWSTFMQTAIDGARTDLESKKPDGRGAALLAALHEAMVDTLAPEIDADLGQPPRLASVSLAITKTELPKPGEGRIVDVFDSAAGAKRPKSVPVSTYDPSQREVDELRTSIVNSYKTRRSQIEMLGRLYGVLGALPERPHILGRLDDAERAVDNRESVRAAGGLKLDNDDSWRTFLLQKYHDLTDTSAGADQRRVRKALSPDDALREIVSLLFGYLQAFTVHARYTNLYDIGVTPYFNRPFPRALTGQLVHDCGVYAMRVAYMLSLVRNELGLKFWFVRLPAHVSLVINGHSGAKLPTFVMENDHYQVFGADHLDQMRKDWAQFQDDAGKKPPGPTDDTQFIGELAANDFIGGPVDMPFRVSEVPKAAGDAKSQQAQLWTYYQGRKMDDVFGPASADKTSPNYLFHRRYLALTERARQMHNDDVLPFWNNRGPAAWGDYTAALEGRGADAKAAARKQVDMATLAPLLVRYRLALGKAIQPLLDAVAAFEQAEKDLGQALRADPKLARPDARFSAGLRAATLSQREWQEHIDAVDSYVADVSGRKAGEMELVEDAASAIEPPWVPAPQYSRSRLD